MGKLQQATPGFSFKLGFLLLPWWPTLVFVAVTLFVLAIPALLVAALGERDAASFPARAIGCEPMDR